MILYLEGLFVAIPFYIAYLLYLNTASLQIMIFVVCGQHFVKDRQ